MYTIQNDWEWNVYNALCSKDDLCKMKICLITAAV